MNYHGWTFKETTHIVVVEVLTEEARILQRADQVYNVREHIVQCLGLKIKSSLHAARHFKCEISQFFKLNRSNRALP